MDDAKCASSLGSLATMNQEIIDGKLGWKACRRILDVLEAPDNAEVWMPWLGEKRLRYEDCFDTLVMALGNAFRRLPFPY